MSAQVIPFPKRTNWEPRMSKRELALFLGVTPRTVTNYMGQGMPSHQQRNGRRMFLLSEVEPWLEGYRKGA